MMIIGTWLGQAEMGECVFVCKSQNLGWAEFAFAFAFCKSFV